MEPQAEELHRRITQWFAGNARELPWRDAERTPWGVLVSEIMLQQTPVVRVLPVWEQWLQRWPTPAGLASEPSGEAVRAWGRLGYPRRALRLHAAAKAIVEEFGGEVPSTYPELLRLPGVGDYTAAAVAAFAFGRRETVVDTNIRRVQARAVTGHALPSPSLTAAEMRLAASLLPAESEDSVAWNASVMELGALVCTARSPRCAECPVLDRCAWVAAGRPEPHYTAKGQAWAGTDRQVRGALMAVLRSADGPVRRELLLHPPVDLEPPRAAVELDPLGALHRLQAPQEQMERALAGLLADRLAAEDARGVSLPL
ncbi:MULTISPECIES: A/G-specific adenine glycosylase [unclassified Arthrobacter]|uniref:A/G-specific adenine glycosylase n=1 Tax=unclassified Arthrobacter TaxID=235627 RepID=UPI001E55E3D9|nr:MULTISPECIES: A/G-specific adenine glycosylase [unclassified Arthrobacter]MCC9144163.1 A/G-specific adenine glycosylase [Arthrobacter sp. zg-Y919]MDK1275388.1 A/G-specific adenine glycosylase [Arthrobacter sp. zg.Y919]MDM7991020.1 A/G-specific adenine glycosylase [Arthrobacter sp. zg-Y877]WIB03228.1 A/G-specific adenine glycosylase [Arthrobacter sp. zg-Y919]